MNNTESTSETSSESKISSQSPQADSRLYQRILGWIVTILVPVALVLTAVRVIMNPWFLPFEYSMPGFPEDRYGFTKQDRLKWSAFALDYLVNDEGIDYLADLKFEDGQPIYNERELYHMVDVKNAVQGVLLTWYISLAGLLVLGFWAWFGKWWSEYLHGLSRGGWLTVIALVFLLTFAIISFGIFFVAFHNVFFEEGTWTFLYSDTLIRLFPERFWRDIFIYVGAIAIGGGLALGIGLRKKV